MSHCEMGDRFSVLHKEARVLAGGLTDLAQRAIVYHSIYRESGGNHVFPLIAAHGALWAGGYFRYGLRLGSLLSWQYGWSGQVRRQKLKQLDDFADALRDINRRVCIDTYVNFHFTRRFGDHPDASNYVPPGLLRALNTVHAACSRRKPLTDEQRQKIFEAHFLHEQETVVSDTLRTASAALNWPVAKLFALRPQVKFAYLPDGEAIRFNNFADKGQRIENGMLAFELAASAGWQSVEQSLAKYGVLPRSFLADPVDYFRRLRSEVLASAGLEAIDALPAQRPECDLAMSR